MSARRAPAFLLVALAAFAGCVSNEASPVVPESILPLDTEWAGKVVAYGGDHDHRDWTQHTGMTTPNFEVLGWDPLEIDGASPGGLGCGGAGITGDGRRITVVNTLDTVYSFIVVDTTDPAKPIHLGHYALENVQTYDVDITADGLHVVIAADIQFNKVFGGLAAKDVPVTLRSKFVDGCTGEVRYGPEQSVLSGPATILVSLADPSNPTFEDYFPAPVIGPHSVSTSTIDNTTYVASSITNLVHPASYFQFFEVASTPLGARLLHLSTVDSGTHGEKPVFFNGHVEAELAKHPITGQLLAYLSNLDGGLVLLDLSIPQAPLEIGAWADPQVDGGSMHGTRVIEGVHGDRHYVLAGQELLARPSDRPSGWIYILDDTDPTNVVEVGRWTLPVESDPAWGPEIRNELFSTHYFRVVGETVFVSMYHGGVWAFQLDLDAPENMKEPASIGAFVPDRMPENAREPTGFYDYTPFILDAFPFEDNTLVVYDGISGAYSVRFDPARPMPAPAPWPASGQEHED